MKCAKEIGSNISKDIDHAAFMAELSLKEINR